MKIIFLTTAALLAAAPAAPAAAQPWQGMRNESAALQAQIDAGVRNGSISQRELPPLREGLLRLATLERQFSPGGISGRENAMLQQEGNALRQQIEFASAARGQGNGNGYGRETDRRAGWEARYDREHRSAWEERYTRDRDAAWDAGQGRGDGYGSNGRFETSTRGDRFAGDVRVGQRASRRMVALPDQYRGEYRDSDEVYYRYDSDRIYEIDRDSGLITRLFDRIG
jgi:hypothetical protein